MALLNTILCPVDFTPVSQLELQLAVALASRFDAELVIQHNLAFGAGLGVSWMHEQERYQEDRAREAEVRANLSAMLAALPADVRVRSRGAITYGALHHDVEQLTRAVDADLIVVGTHGRHGERASESLRLVTRGPCPVLTIRDGAPHDWMPALDSAETIVTIVPIDLSDHSIRALRYAAQLQQTLPLDLLAMYVTERGDRGPEWVREQVRAAVPDIGPEHIDFEVVHGRTPEQILLEERFSAAGLVVMSAHVRGLFERITSGRRSTAAEVMRSSLCPVWFVPDSARV